MCEHCALLRYVLTKSPTNGYPACASTHPDDGNPSTCASCAIFALIHQNTFAKRWNDIQNALVVDHQPQLHPSLDSLQPGISSSSPTSYGASPLFIPVTNPASPAPIVRYSINLILPPHAHVELQKVFTVNLSSNLCTMIHIAHPDIPITMKDLHSLHSHKIIFNSTIFHHLRITAISTLISHDRTMYVTADQIAYPLTSPSASHQDI